MKVRRYELGMNYLEENHLESQSKPDLRLDPQLQRGYSLYDAYAGGGHTLDL